MEEEPRRPEEAAHLHANFRRMSIWFAVNHACSTTPLVYATTVLSPEVGFLGNGVLYTCSLLSALLLSVAVVHALGLKGSLIAAMALYAFYVGSFTLAMLGTIKSALHFLPAPSFVLGSAACGLAAGLLWTAEGGYMAHTATGIAEAEQNPREQITSHLAGEFAFFYLMFEVAAKCLFSLLQYLHMKNHAIGIVYTCISVFSTLMMTQIDNLRHHSGRPDDRTLRKPGEDSKELRPDVETPSPFSKLFNTVQLWSDAKIWLLSPTNLAFGFSAAYMNGYFNSHFAKVELGAASIGVLTSITVGAAAIFSKVYSKIGTHFGKGAAITAGAISFGLIPTLVVVTRCCRGFGGWLLIFYLLQGSGRAVYESTNKAVFSDFFTGEQTEGAFANCSLQMSAASAALFFISGKIPAPMLGAMVLGAALVTPLVYALTVLLHSRGGEHRHDGYAPPGTEYERQGLGAPRDQEEEPFNGQNKSWRDHARDRLQEQGATTPAE